MVKNIIRAKNMRARFFWLCIMCFGLSPIAFSLDDIQEQKNEEGVPVVEVLQKEYQELFNSDKSDVHFLKNKLTDYHKKNLLEEEKVRNIFDLIKRRDAVEKIDSNERELLLRANFKALDHKQNLLNEEDVNIILLCYSFPEIIKRKKGDSTIEHIKICRALQNFCTLKNTNSYKITKIN